MTRLTIVFALAFSLVLVPVASAQQPSQDTWPPSCDVLPISLMPAMLAELFEDYKAAPGIQAHNIHAAYTAIVYGHDQLRPFSVGSEVITPEMLAAMTEEEGLQLADAWLDGRPQGQAALDAYYAAREEYLTQHPEVAGFIAFQEQARAYPGGQGQFISDLALDSATYRRYLGELSALAVPGSAAWIERALDVDGYLIVAREAQAASGLSCDEGRFRAHLWPTIRS
jgi:hypothetical protein